MSALEELGIGPEKQKRFEDIIGQFDTFMTNLVGGGYELEDAFVDTGKGRTVFKISVVPTALLKDNATIDKSLEN